MSEYEKWFTSEFFSAFAKSDPPLCSEDAFCECTSCIIDIAEESAVRSDDADHNLRCPRDH